MSQLKFNGHPMRIGDKVMVVPALSVRQVKLHRADLSVMSAIAGREPTDEEVDKLMKVALAALNRNYPDLTLDQLEDAVDLNSLPDVIAAVTGQTGLQAKATSGEAEGAQSTGAPLSEGSAQA